MQTGTTDRAWQSRQRLSTKGAPLHEVRFWTDTLLQLVRQSRTRHISRVVMLIGQLFPTAKAEATKTPPGRQPMLWGDYVVLQDVLDPHRFHTVFKNLDRDRLDFATVFGALRSGNLAACVRADRLPLTERDSIEVCKLLLLIWYMQTLRPGSPDIADAVRDLNRQRPQDQPSHVLPLQMPVPLLMEYALQRRIFLLEGRPWALAVNEDFEVARMEFLKSSIPAISPALPNESSLSRAKGRSSGAIPQLQNPTTLTRGSLPPQRLEFLRTEAMGTISKYLNSSVTMVTLSLRFLARHRHLAPLYTFDPANITLILTILERGDPEHCIPSIQLLTTWTAKIRHLFNSSSSARSKELRAQHTPLILRAVTMVRSLLVDATDADDEDDPPGGWTLFLPTCIHFLGTSYGLVPKAVRDPTFAIVERWLDDPDRLLSVCVDGQLAAFFNGLVPLTANVSHDQLDSIASKVLALFEDYNHSPFGHSGRGFDVSRQLEVLVFFHLAFITRTFREDQSQTPPKQDWRPAFCRPILEQAVAGDGHGASSSHGGGGVRRMVAASAAAGIIRAHHASLQRLKQHGGVQAKLRTPTATVRQVMARLLALVRQTRDDGLDSVKTLDQILWRRTLAISCAHCYTGLKLNQTDSMDMVALFGSVLRSDLLAHEWVLDDIGSDDDRTPRSIERKLLVQTSSKGFTQASLIGRTVGTILQTLPVGELLPATQDMLAYARSARNTWSRFRAWNTDRGSSGEKVRSDMIMRLFQGAFMAFTMFYVDVLGRLPPPCFVTVIETFAMLDFCRVDFANYRRVLRKALAVFRANESLVRDLVLAMPARYDPDILVPLEPRASPEDASDANRRPPVQLFLSVMRQLKMGPKLSEDLNVGVYLPVLCRYLTYPGRSVNKLVQAELRYFVDARASYLDAFLPYFIEQSLDAYPRLTQLDALALMMRYLCQGGQKYLHWTWFALKRMRARVEALRVAAAAAAEAAEGGAAEGDGDQDENPIFAQMLTLLLLQLTIRVPVALLTEHLDLARDCLLSVPKDWQKPLCASLYQVLSNNHDYERKHECVNWYLRLVSETQQK